jgi:hypothetical protein
MTAAEQEAAAAAFLAEFQSPTAGDEGSPFGTPRDC